MDELHLSSFLDPIAKVWGNAHQFLTGSAVPSKEYKNRVKKENAAVRKKRLPK